MRKLSNDPCLIIQSALTRRTTWSNQSSGGQMYLPRRIKILNTVHARRHYRRLKPNISSWSKSIRPLPMSTKWGRCRCRGSIRSFPHRKRTSAPKITGWNSWSTKMTDSSKNAANSKISRPWWVCQWYHKNFKILTILSCRTWNKNTWERRSRGLPENLRCWKRISKASRHSLSSPCPQLSPLRLISL